MFRKRAKAKHIFFRRDRQFLPFGLFHRIAAQMGGASAPLLPLLKVMGRATKLTGRRPVHESSTGQVVGEGSDPAVNAEPPVESPSLARPSGVKAKNLYSRMEWAGAFGDIGTLIPFVVAYITLVHVDPLGLLFMFGACKILAGLYYKTPVPIQPMKAIGAAAIAGGMSPAMLFGSGITTGLFWLIVGATGTIKWVAKLATRAVVRGVMLGLGLSFVVEGVHRMATAPLLAGIALVLTYLLLNNPKIPAMFVLLVVGIVSAVIMNPHLLSELSMLRIGFKLPSFGLHGMTWDDVVKGTLVFTLPQIPLTLGNAVIAIVGENNELFPDRPITEKKIVDLSRNHEPGCAFLWGRSHVPRGRRHGWACPFWRKNGRRARHPRIYRRYYRLVLQ